MVAWAKAEVVGSTPRPKLAEAASSNTIKVSVRTDLSGTRLEYMKSTPTHC